METIKKGVISYMLIALVLFQTEAAFAWGNEGHTYINRVAAQKIPASMPLFLRQAVVEIAYLGPEPDRWRSANEPELNAAQAPEHFIDLELADTVEVLFGRTEKGLPPEISQFCAPEGNGLAVSLVR